MGEGVIDVSGAQCKENVTEKSKRIPKCDYMWLLVFACFMCSCLTWGMNQSFGAFVVHFEKFFNVPKSDIASIGSLSNGCFFIFGPVYGGLLNKFSCRQVATCGFLVSALGFLLSAISPSISTIRVTFILTGIGFGSAATACLSCITLYTSDRRGITIGIVSIGTNVGTMCLAPVINFLFQFYGLSGTMLIFVGIALNGVLFSMLMGMPISKSAIKNKQAFSLKLQEVKASKHEPVALPEKNLYQTNEVTVDQKLEKDIQFHKEKDSQVSYSSVCCSKSRNLLKHISVFFMDLKNGLNIQLVKGIPFLLLCFGFLFNGIGYYMPLIFFPDCAASKGLSTDKAVLLLSAYAIAGIPGKLILGYIVDRIKINVIIQFCLYSFISSASLLAIPFYFSFVALMCIAGIFGFFMASVAIHFPVMVVEVVGTEYFNSGLGICFVSYGLAITLGPPLAGFIYDTTKSYDFPFFMASGCLILSVLIFLLIPCFTRKEKIEASGETIDTKESCKQTS